MAERIRPGARPLARATPAFPSGAAKAEASAPAVLALALLWLALLLAPAIGLAPQAQAQTQAQAQREAPEVFGVRFGVNDGITRIVLDIDGATRFATRTLTSPPRLLIELENVRWRVRDHPQSRLTGIAKAVTYGHLENGRGRLVVETDRPFRIVREERLPPSGDARQHRILVDLAPLPQPTAPPPVAAAPPAPPPPAAPPAAGRSAGNPQAGTPRTATPPGAGGQAPSETARQAPSPPPATAGPNTAGTTVAGAAPRTLDPPRTGPPRARPGTYPPVSAEAGSGSLEAPARLPLPGVDEPGLTPPEGPDAETAPPSVDVVAAPVLLPPPPPQRRHVIALDPGHGGADPGTIGINGVLEKDVTLDVARRLKALIEATGRYEVVMTRDSDVFISLRDRMERARGSDAALFISIHADSLGDAKFRGASVYTLSDQASDTEAARLATKENRADVIAGTDLSAHDEVVAGILIDLAQRVTNNKSIAFADLLAAELGEVTPLVRNTRRFAGFVVLKSPDVPSVLLELGYLSNPTDAANLARPEYRDGLARTTLKAIDRYFAQADTTL